MDENLSWRASVCVSKSGLHMDSSRELTTGGRELQLGPNYGGANYSGANFSRVRIMDGWDARAYAYEAPPFSLQLKQFRLAICVLTSLGHYLVWKLKAFAQWHKNLILAATFDAMDSRP